jgi:hypothetical protein
VPLTITKKLNQERTNETEETYEQETNQRSYVGTGQAQADHHPGTHRGEPATGQAAQETEGGEEMSTPVWTMADTMDYNELCAMMKDELLSERTRELARRQIENMKRKYQGLPPNPQPKEPMR